MESNPLSYDTWLSCRLRLLWIDEIELQPRFSGVVQHPNAYSAWFMRTGSASVRLKNRDLTASTNEWMILPPNARLQRFSKDASWLSLRFKAHWQTGEPLLVLRDGMVVANDAQPELLRKAVPVLEAVCGLERYRWHHLPDFPIELPMFLSVHARFLDWCNELLTMLSKHKGLVTIEPQTDPRIRLVVEKLEAWPLTEPYDAKELAGLVKLSSSQLDRLFQQYLHMTPRRFLDHRRLDLARELLSRVDLEVKEAAYECGFQGAAQFSIWFRKHQGTSPSNYRRILDLE